MRNDPHPLGYETPSRVTSNRHQVVPYIVFVCCAGTCAYFTRRAVRFDEYWEVVFFSGLAAIVLPLLIRRS